MCLQVSTLQGENRQLVESLHAVNTAAADALQRVALLEGQLRDVCHQLKESQEAGASADFRLSAAEADLDESRQRLQETQVSCSHTSSEVNWGSEGGIARS